MMMLADPKSTKTIKKIAQNNDDAGQCGVSVAEVLGGVDINWSPPITDWSHHYGNDDRDDNSDDGDNDECDDDHDNIKCCYI